MRRRLLPLPGNELLAASLARHLDADDGGVRVRAFPDGESHVQIDGDVTGRDVAVVCSLDRPNERTIPLVLLAATARDLGARRVGLIAPYLGYLRQDARFRPGEGVTSAYFARLLSDWCDWVVTVDPHLHRYAALDAVYTVPTRVVSVAPLLAAWIAAEVPDAVIVGPDAESAQWVGAVARAARVPSMVGRKLRRGDRDVEVTLPSDTALRHRTPVVVDDVVSTGTTLLATIARLRAMKAAPPVCFATHAIFAADAYERLLDGGAARVVTSNTIAHFTNAIDVAPLLAEATRTLSHETQPRAVGEG